MSGAVAENRFAPPRADVEDPADDAGSMVDAPRVARLLAFLVDIALPLVFFITVVAALTIPAYESYRQARVPGIAPPAAGQHHVTTTLARLAGAALIAFYAWSIVLVVRYGQTFGKRLLSIRVVRTDGSRVAFARFAFLRWLPLFIAHFVPLVNFIMLLLDPLLIFRQSRRCLHDEIADTRVVTAASSVDATLNGDAKYARTGLRTITF